MDCTTWAAVCAWVGVEGGWELRGWGVGGEGEETFPPPDHNYNGWHDLDQALENA